MNTIKSYKGFDVEFKCRGFQFEVGKTYQHEGLVEACKAGFHACEYPLDVLRYYEPGTSRFAIVTQMGKLSRHEQDSKVASSGISIDAEIGLSELIKDTVAYVIDRRPVGHPSAAGWCGTASATGRCGIASSTGECGAASATGRCGIASATGEYGAASAAGWRGIASATGEYGAASAAGWRGTASATGEYGAASATGEHGAALATGEYGAASATGRCGIASSTGKHGVASSVGIDGKAKASTTGAIVLCHRLDDGTIQHIRASKVGENGIKPDTWYELDANGDFIESTE